jgi:hypothetical protein
LSLNDEKDYSTEKQEEEKRLLVWDRAGENTQR